MMSLGMLMMSLCRILIIGKVNDVIVKDNDNWEG